MGANPSKREVSVLVGQRVRELRKARGMSMGQLAPLVGIASGQLYKLEVGDRMVTVDDLAMLTAALGVTATELIRRPATGPVRWRVWGHSAVTKPRRTTRA